MMISQWSAFVGISFLIWKVQIPNPFHTKEFCISSTSTVSWTLYLFTTYSTYAVDHIYMKRNTYSFSCFSIRAKGFRHLCISWHASGYSVKVSHESLINLLHEESQYTVQSVLRADCTIKYVQEQCIHSWSDTNDAPINVFIWVKVGLFSPWINKC